MIPENYRPIAILSPLSKIIEQLILTRLEAFFQRHSLLSPFQFGFQKNKSTESPALSICELIKNNIESKLLTMGIFIDLRKAFDTINHTLLCNKLERYGIRGVTLDLLRSFLLNRR